MILPRFYPILDAALLERRGFSTIAAAEALLEGGARILQFRWKGHFSREMFAQMELISKLCAHAGALLVVNDRADLARLLGAALHLGQDDLLPADARRIITKETIIGFSTHNEVQLRAAAEEPVDYLAIGPIFATESKQNPDPVLGLKELKRLRGLTAKPLVAIGGVTRLEARAVLEAGADSVAVIGDLVPEICTNDTLRSRTKEWLQLLNK